MAYTDIDDPTIYFNTLLWTGNGADGRALTGVGFQPDWVWIKDRDDTESHRLTDSVRGATKSLRSNGTNAEATESDGLQSFDSDGFTVGTQGSMNKSNADKFVGWSWKAGTSFSNDASATSVGTIDSTGSVSDTAGFSIVSYTGTGSAGTIKHGLSTAPSVVLVKSRGGVYGWGMYHHKNTSAPATDYLSINNSDATVDDSVFWNDTAPTSSVFSLGGTDAINKASTTHIAYCFAEKKGYSKFGSYVGNGSTNGQFSFLGFKPSMVILKRTNSSASWLMFDNKRDIDNVVSHRVYANGNDAEDSDTGSAIDFLSNGFKNRSSDNSTNASGSTYIYMAFAESPFVNSNGIPNNAR